MNNAVELRNVSKSYPNTGFGLKTYHFASPAEIL